MTTEPTITLYAASPLPGGRTPACRFDAAAGTTREVWPGTGALVLCDMHARLRAEAHRTFGRSVEDRRPAVTP